jgi:sodium/bile acid cotransporter 7
MYFLTGKLAGLLRFSAEDRITAQYCGTKKSLVHGTVFSKILFPASMPLGYLLLPLMLYHALQIFVISLLAGRERQNK